MASNIGTRQDSKPKIVFMIPSFTWTKGVPLPVPYPIIKNTHTPTENVSEDVHYNGSPAFKADSYGKDVTADEAGEKFGGLFSGTRSDKHEPKSYSESVHVNGEGAVRNLDIGWMNNKNTIGLYIYDTANKPDITDTGKSPDADEAPKVPSFMEFF